MFIKTGFLMESYEPSPEIPYPGSGRSPFAVATATHRPPSRRRRLSIHARTAPSHPPRIPPTHTMRTLRKARPAQFASDLAPRTLLRDRGDAPHDKATLSTLTEERDSTGSKRRSLPDDVFDEPASLESDFPAYPATVNASGFGSLRGEHRTSSSSPWHSSDAQSGISMKHRSLGPGGGGRTFADANQASLAAKHRSLDVLGGAGGNPISGPRAALRHRSLGRSRRERSAAQEGLASPQRSGMTPSFLEGMVERVRSASPSPASLSSNPQKIIASLPGGARQSSLPAFSQDGSRLTAGFASEDQSVSSVRSNSSVFGLRNRGGPRTTSQIGRQEFDFGGSRNHSSASLRRVLSLGRSRQNSDAHSIVSEPVVYAESAHISDDIWIAPKDLYSVERRVALKQFHKQQAAQQREDAIRAAEEKARTVDKLKKVEHESSVTTTGDTEYQLEEFVEEEMPDDESLMSSRADNPPPSTRSAMTDGIPRRSMNSSITDRNVRSDQLLFASGPADMNHMESSLGRSDYNPDKPDPFEYGTEASEGIGMSSRLIRLFFNSGSQNPMPPSAVRAAELRRQNGSSRSLFRRRDRSQANIHQHQNSHSSFRGPNFAGNMGMPPNKSTASSMNGMFGAEKEPTMDRDFRSKIRDISKFANVRAWIRRRTYRRSQRMPERRPMEAQT